MAAPKRHHTIPKFYLQRFANQDGHVAVHRRGTPVYTTHVRNVGVVGGFNTVTLDTGEESLLVEEFLSKSEGETAPLLDAIVSTGRIPADSRQRHLAEFMGLLYLRTPEQRAKTNIQEEIFGKMTFYMHTEESLRELFTEKQGRAPTDAELTLYMEAVARIDEFDLEFASNVHLQDAIRIAIEDIAPVLLGMHWQLVHSATPVFFTSDHPIVLSRHPTARNRGRGIGPGNADHAYFPVDPRHALLLSREAPSGPEKIAATPTLIRKITRLMMADFLDWIAYHPDQSDPLAGHTVPRDRPIIEVNGVQIFADGRGKDEALRRVRELIMEVKRGQLSRPPFIHLRTMRSH